MSQMWSIDDDASSLALHSSAEGNVAMFVSKGQTHFGSELLTLSDGNTWPQANDGTEERVMWTRRCAHSSYS